MMEEEEKEEEQRMHKERERERERQTPLFCDAPAYTVCATNRTPTGS